MDPSDAIERFLSTGTWDPAFPDWEGPLAERRRRGTATLREILCRVVAWRASRAPVAIPRAPADREATIRRRLRPMLAGLFDPPDAAALIEALPGRVSVLTPASFPAAAATLPLATAWDLANLLLDDLRAPPLSDDVPQLDGLCAAGRAYVLPRALAAPPGVDVLVHEAAHLLHLLPRAALGLEPAALPILAVPPRRRETFAYGLEAYAVCLRDGVDTIGELGRDDARVDPARLRALVEEARAGGGWAVFRRYARVGR